MKKENSEPSFKTPKINIISNSFELSEEIENSDSFSEFKKIDRISSRQSVRDSLRDFGTDKFSTLHDIVDDSDSNIWNHAWYALDKADGKYTPF